MKRAIYGAGVFGKLFLSAFDGKIDFFIDDFTKESTCKKIPIKKLSAVPKDTKIFISMLQHSKNIQQKLMSKGFKNVIGFTESISFMPNILREIAKTNYLWIVKEREQMINKEKLKKVQKLLCDNKSHQLLQKIIQLRETLDIKYYIKPEGIEYFPSDIPFLNNLSYINFVDCGSYIGDSVEELMKHHPNIKSSISFEPDKQNLLKLNKTLNKLSDYYPQTNFFLYPAGVYSKNSILKFENLGINSSAKLNDKAIVNVPVVSLDSVILNANPNFIKMDIEGAEKEAIRGATKTIQKYKPNLAICLYHKPEDLWEIPLLIQEIEPSYDMYIRVHEDMCLSTVLYCVSRSNNV